MSTLRELGGDICELVGDYISDFCIIQSSCIVNHHSNIASESRSWNELYDGVIHAKIFSLENALNFIVFLQNLSMSERNTFPVCFDLNRALDSIFAEYEIEKYFAKETTETQSKEVNAFVTSFLEKNKCIEVPITHFEGEYATVHDIVISVMHRNVLDFSGIMKFVLFMVFLTRNLGTPFDFSFTYVDLVKYYDIANRDLMDYIDEDDCSTDTSDVGEE